MVRLPELTDLVREARSLIGGDVPQRRSEFVERKHHLLDTLTTIGAELQLDADQNNPTTNQEAGTVTATISPTSSLSRPLDRSSPTPGGRREQGVPPEDHWRAQCSREVAFTGRPRPLWTTSTPEPAAWPISGSATTTGATTSVDAVQALTCDGSSSDIVSISDHADPVEILNQHDQAVDAISQVRSRLAKIHASIKEGS